MKLFITFTASFSLFFSVYISPASAQPSAKTLSTLDTTKGAKINVYIHESKKAEVKEKPVFLVHGFNSDGKVWSEGENNYVEKLIQGGYDVVVVDMRGNAVDTDGDHVVDAPVVGDSWGYSVKDLGDDVGAALIHSIDYLNKNLPGRDYKKADVITHSTGALAVTSYSRSQGLIPYRNNIDTIIELAPPNNGSTSLVANIKQTAQIIPSVFMQSMIAYEYALEMISSKVWIPGSRMESENLRKELMPESLFLKSIEGLGPDPSIKTYVAMGDEDWVVGDWSPVIEERGDIGYEYFLGLDHFSFCESELVILALLDKLEKRGESKFFSRYKPYRDKSLITFLSGPGIDHPDDTFDVTTFAKDIDISPRKLFDLYLRIAGRKDKIYILKFWEAVSVFEKAQKEIDGGGEEAEIIDRWRHDLEEQNNLLRAYFNNASKQYLECPDIAILANGYYKELAKLIIEQIGEPVRIIDQTFSPSIINEQKLLLIPSGGLSGLSHSAIFRKKLSEFVKNGGTLVCFSQQYGYDFNALPAAELAAYGWQEDASCYSKAAYIENFHQILASQKELYPDLKIDGYFTDYPEGAKILLRRSKNLMPAMLMYDFEKGRVIVSSLYSDWGYANGQASAAEIALIRDLVRWAKKGQALPEHVPGQVFRQAVDVKREFDKVETILISPDSTLLERKFSSTAEYELGVNLNSPGIYYVDYMLYNADNEIIQPQTEGIYFCFSQPPEGSVESPDFTFNITTDSENYINGSKAVFTFHIKNNTDRGEAIKCKAQFNHLDLKFTESIDCPAKSEVSFDKTWVVTKTDMLTANFYSLDNDFLGRRERGVNVYEPSVATAITSDKKQYVPGQEALIDSDVTNNSKVKTEFLLILNILDSENKQVFYKTKTVTLAEAENYVWKESYNLPQDAIRGEYRIKLEAYLNSKLAGASSATMDIPGPLLYEEDALPAGFFEFLEIVLGKLVYEPGEAIPAEIIINNTDEKIDSAILDVKVLPSVEKGDLCGVVRDAAANPIAGALVNTVYTNADGRYRLDGITKGKYALEASANGYDKFTGEIDILGGSNTSDITLRASEYKYYSGTLPDSIGSYLTLEPVDVKASYADKRYAVAGTDGKFEFKRLPVGDYELNIQPENIIETVSIAEGLNASLFEALFEATLSKAKPWTVSVQGLALDSASKSAGQEIEPNGDFDAANDSGACAAVTGAIYDYGDEDYFRLNLDSAGILEISVTDVVQGFRPNLKIYNSARRMIASTAALSGEEIEYHLEISEPGIYYISLKDRYNTFSSQEEYILKFDFTPGADQYEPNQNFNNAPEVETRKTIEPTIFPAGDEDYFKFDIQEKGIFYIKMIDVPQGLRPSLKIYDSKGKVVSQKGGSAGEKIGLETEIGEAGIYYLLVRDWYSSFSSIESYSFKAYFIKTVDEFEPSGTKEQAKLIEFGKEYFATIATKGDSDFYRISAPDAGRVTVYLKDLPPNIRPYMKLYRDTGASWIDSAAGNAGEDLSMHFDAIEPSNYFVQVQDRYNSESSFLRYAFLAVYVPDTEYASGAAPIFEKEIEVSNVVNSKKVKLDIPGIADIGKYYLQAALKSEVAEKNSQAVERFYVSDLANPVEPAPISQIEVSCLENENSEYEAGKNAIFKFRAANNGTGGGSCRIDFKFEDIFSRTMTEFLEPGAEKTLQFEFALPADLEEGAYEAEYIFEDKKHAVKFQVKSAKIEVDAGFEDNIFELDIKNIGSVKGVELFAEARCGDFEERKDFALEESAKIVFNIPGADTAGQEKIYYGIYFDTGKALYLNSYLLSQGEEPGVSLRVIEAMCDKNSYTDGEIISISWRLELESAGELKLLADLIAPDSSAAEIINEDINFNKGENELERDAKLELGGSGLYRILYRFIYEDSVLAQGSLFFDAGEEVNVELRPEKNEYIENDPIKIKANCFSSAGLKGELKLFVDGEIEQTKNINFDGYREFNFNIKIAEAGEHRLYCSLVYDGKRVDSKKETLVISARPKPNNSPVLFTIGEKKVIAGGLLEFSIEAADLDGDKIFYSTEGLPEGAGFDASAGKFSWRPGYEQRGTYFVTFTASDKKDAASERVEIVVTEYIPLPTKKPLAAPMRGMAPLEVEFSAESVDETGFVKYEWDFDGKGVYDFSSLQSGDAAFVYTGAGDFTAVLRVTDKNGQVKTWNAEIDVEENSSAPAVLLDASPLKGVAPCKVYFKGSVFSAADICRYEWDFDGDGVYDACSQESGEVVKTYTVPGSYAAAFRVMNAEGLSASDTAVIEVSDPDCLKVNAVLSQDKGNVPLEIDFDAVVDTEGEIQKYQWDFEGDGVFDFTSTESAVTRHTYFQPGLYAPTLRVTDEENISAESKKEIRLSVLDKNNVKCGRLSVKERKGKAPFKVKFSFDTDFDLSGASYLWDFDGNGVCDLVTEAPEAEFTYTDSGVYVAEVNVKAVDSRIRSCRTIIYLTNGKNIKEKAGVSTALVLKNRQNVFKDRSDKIELSDKTYLILPAGILEADDVVDIKKLEEGEVLKEIIFEEVENFAAAGEYREYKFGNHKEGFSKEMTISIPYSDRDNDGFIDEKYIDEATLDGYWFDGAADEWRMLSDVLVFPKEDLVTVKTNHFSVFGIAGVQRQNEGISVPGDPGGASGGSGGGASCFIATAAYGTPLAGEVKTLCEFRNKCLLESRIGRIFVGFYYKLSPPIADFIKDKPLLTALIRYHLKCLVKLTQFVL